MRRSLRWLGVVLALSATAVAGAPGPACACSCAAATEQEYAGRADLVFEGVVVDIDEPLWPTSGADPVTVRFLVETVSKGEAGDRVTLRTAMDSATCGYAFTLQHRYRVFAVGGLTDACAGNRDLGPAPDVPVEEGWPWRLIGVCTVALVVVAAVALLRRGRHPRGL